MDDLDIICLKKREINILKMQDHKLNFYGLKTIGRWIRTNKTTTITIINTDDRLDKNSERRVLCGVSRVIGVVKRIPWYEKYNDIYDKKTFTKLDDDWILIGKSKIVSREGENYNFFKIESENKVLITSENFITDYDNSEIEIQPGSDALQTALNWAKNGEKYYFARGKTYEYKEILRDLGFIWKHDHKIWYSEKKPNVIILGISFGLVKKEVVRPPRVNVAIGNTLKNKEALKADGFKWSGSHWYRDGKKPTLKLDGIEFIRVESIEILRK